jgi:probable phosphoglycerate mutase
MTTLALLRHGPTEWNAGRRLQGRADIPLSSEGRAALVARRVPVEFTGFRCLVSPLTRARETAILLGLGAEIDARLIEMDWGAYQGRTIGDLRQEIGAAFLANEARGLDFQPEGGESPRMVQDRVQPLLAEIAVRRRSTLAVTHRGVMRAVYALAAGWDMTGEPPHELDWYSMQIFELESDGRPRVAALNVPLAERLRDGR